MALDIGLMGKKIKYVDAKIANAGRCYLLLIKIRKVAFISRIFKQISDQKVWLRGAKSCCCIQIFTFTTRSGKTQMLKLNSDKTVNGQKQRKREPSSGFWVKMAAAAKDSSSGGATSSVKGVLTHGGKYVQYNVYGNLFEVSSKYVPPIRPIGRGAYGIVWWVFFPPFFLFILIIYPSLLSIY